MGMEWNIAEAKEAVTAVPREYSLKFVALNTLRPFLRTANVNEYVIVMTARYSKLRRAVLTGKTSSTHVASMLFDYWIVPYGMCVYVLTNNGVKFTRNLFATLCNMLGVKHITKTSFHPQTNRKVEQYDHTIVTQLRHYVVENHKDCDSHTNVFLQRADAWIHKHEPF